MDLEMPHLNGITCLQAVRRINPRVPVLMVSGASAADIPRAEIESLGSSLLTKPFNKTHLLTAISAFLKHPPVLTI